MLGFTLAGLVTPVTVVGSMMVFMLGFGIAAPTALAGAMAPFPMMAGAASAMIGFAQMAMAVTRQHRHRRLSTTTPPCRWRRSCSRWVPRRRWPISSSYAARPRQREAHLRAGGDRHQRDPDRRGSPRTDLHRPVPSVRSRPSAAALGADVAATQLTLSIFLAAFALAQIPVGPLSDRFGRRPILLAGLAVYVMASFACAVAPTIEALIAARAVQAIGACAGVVLGRAIVRDIYGRDRAARMLAYIGTAMALAPMIGPIARRHSSRADFGWRWNFAILLTLRPRDADPHLDRPAGVERAARSDGARSAPHGGQFRHAARRSRLSRLRADRGIQLCRACSRSSPDRPSC